MYKALQNFTVYPPLYSVLGFVLRPVVRSLGSVSLSGEVWKTQFSPYSLLSTRVSGRSERIRAPCPLRCTHLTGVDDTASGSSADSVRS